MDHFFITGGCGFIGSNLTATLLADGNRVTVFDNLSRRGTEKNRDWLLEKGHQSLTIVEGDVRDLDQIRTAVDAAQADALIHTAGQVAVTTSVVDPREDFMINALGTFNVLESVRLHKRRLPMLLTSTNKVYGGMENVKITERNGRYEYESLSEGASEAQPLDFHSPYGCSKGAADQYVRDYARIYNIPTVVFRMSCQYGPRQFGNEDQGWVAHFVIAAQQGRGLTVFGNGKQVRDILFVEDLVRAIRMALGSIEKTAGLVFNIGGGPANAMSLLELIALLENLTGRKLNVSFGDWRPGDQPVYISNIEKARREFGWEPTISKTEGIARLLEWVRENEGVFV